MSKVTKYYYLNDEGKLEPALPLYYRQGSRFVRYADYFKVSGGFVTGDRVYRDDGFNQNPFGKGEDVDQEKLNELIEEME